MSLQSIPERTDERALARLHPAYFALVMATGILAIACHLLRIPTLPSLLFAINVVAYVVLWILTAARALRHTRLFFADFASHQRGPGFFTVVAATSVLGVQLAIQHQMLGAARSLWWVAFALWLLPSPNRSVRDSSCPSPG